jgi:hypothetical protein
MSHGFVNDLNDFFPPHVRDYQNEQTVPLSANQIFTGQFTKIDHYPSYQILYAALKPIAGVRLEWSNDGVNPLTGALQYTTLPITGVNGYNVAYGVGLGNLLAPYYRLVVANSGSGQGVFPDFISLNWLTKTPYNGSFGRLEAGLNNLSLALLTRSVLAANKPDGTFQNIGATTQGDLKVGQQAVVGTGNTTFIPLSGGTTFTGAWEYIADYSTMRCAVKADQPGILYQDHSDDGITIRRTSVFNIYADTDFYISSAPRWKYIRFRLENTGNHQSYLAMQTFWSYLPNQHTLLPLDTNLSDRSISATNRAVLAGRKENGEYANVGLTNQNDLRVGQKGVVSETTVVTGTSTTALIGNSVTGILNAGASFTGAWEDLTNFSAISILGVTTQNSATNGALAQFSNDGVSVIRTVPATIIGTAVGGAGIAQHFAPEGKFFRVVYTNGSVATTLKSQVVYHYLAPAVVQSPIGGGLTDINLASITRAIITAKKPDGTYTNVGATVQGDLRVGQKGVISTLNSTSIPLSGNAGWTGTFEDVADFSSISVAFLSNTNSQISGAGIQFSDDGTGIVREIKLTMLGTDNGGEGISSTLPSEAKFFRLFFNNGPINQNRFIIQTIYRYLPASEIQLPIITPLNDYNLGALNRSVLAGKRQGTNQYNNVGTDASGRLLVNNGSEFARYLNRQIENSEELKLDIEPSNTDYYLGICPDGTPDASGVHNIVRIYLSATRNPTRIRFRQNLTWTGRALGWS